MTVQEAHIDADRCEDHHRPFDPPRRTRTVAVFDLAIYNDPILPPITYQPVAGGPFYNVTLFPSQGTAQFSPSSPREYLAIPYVQLLTSAGSNPIAPDAFGNHEIQMTGLPVVTPGGAVDPVDEDGNPVLLFFKTITIVQSFNAQTLTYRHRVFLPPANAADDPTNAISNTSIVESSTVLCVTIPGVGPVDYVWAKVADGVNPTGPRNVFLQQAFP
jgi:hypothetical protein